MDNCTNYKQVSGYGFLLLLFSALKSVFHEKDLSLTYKVSVMERMSLVFFAYSCVQL